jgi:hypothetical protein
MCIASNRQGHGSERTTNVTRCPFAQNRSTRGRHDLEDQELAEQSHRADTRRGRVQAQPQTCHGDQQEDRLLP